MQTRPWTLGVGAMLLSNVFFSLMAILLRVDPTLGGVQAAFVRFAVGGFVVVTAALVLGQRLIFRDVKGLLGRGLFGGLSVALYFLPINEIGLGKTSLFQYTYPFYAILFSAVFLKERLTPAVVGLLGLVVAGLVLLSWPSLSEGHWNGWVLVAWASGVLSGLAVMFVKKLSAEESSRSIFLAQCLGGFWLLLVPTHLTPTPAGWLPALLLVGVGLAAAAGQLLMTWSYKHVDVATGSLLGTLVPVVNVAAGVLWFGEAFNPLEAWGAALTLLACVLLVLVKMRPR